MPDAVADQKPWEQFASQKPWELYGKPDAAPAPESIDQEDQLLTPAPAPAPSFNQGILDTIHKNDARQAALGLPFASVQPNGSVVQAPPQNDPEANTAEFNKIQKPFIPIPKFTVNPDDSKTAAVGKEAVNLLLGIPEFMESPAGLITLPLGGVAPKTVAGLFAVDSAKNAGEQIIASHKDWDKYTPAQKAQAVTDIAGQIGFAGLLGHAASGGFKGGVKNASKIESPATVGEQPGGTQSPGGSGSQGVGPGDQGKAPAGSGQATQTQVPLTEPDHVHPFDSGNRTEQFDYSPENLAKYKQMTGDMKNLVKTAASDPAALDKMMSIQGQLEELKNRYNGHVPKNLESAGTGTPDAGTKNAPADVRSPAQSGLHVQHDEETGEWHTVNAKDEIVSSHATMDAAAKAAAPDEGKAPEPEPFLEPADQKTYDYELKKVGTPVRFTEPDDESNPFHSDTIATIDRKNGSIVINRDLMKQWLSDIPKSQRPTAIRSLLAEEQIHLHTDDAAANTYWKNLSPWEQSIAKRSYDPNGTVQGMDDTLWGHEALRMRIQQLARMKTSEVAAAVGKEKWTLKGLSILEHAIRGARAVLNFRAGRESRAILQRVQANIDAARAAISGSSPRAIGRGRPKVRPEPKEQQDFMLPGMESTRLAGSKIAASNVPGQEGAELPQTPEDVKAAGEAKVASVVPQRPSAAELGKIGEKALYDDVAARLEDAKKGKNTRLPNLKDFTSDLKKRWSSLKPGEISDIWSGTVGKFIGNASGEDLRLLGKSAFGGNVREILSDKDLNEKFPGNTKAAVEYAKRQERALDREGRKGSSIWNAPVVDKDFGTEAAERVDLAHAQDKYPGVGIDALDLHWADQRAQAEFERRNKLFSEGKIEAAPSLEKLKVAELQEVAEGKRLASKKYQLERSLAKSRELRSIQSAKRRRAWISSAVFRKMVKPEVADNEGILNRKSVTPDDVRPSNDGKYSSYEDVSDFPKSKMEAALVDKARRSSSDSATVTRRLAVLENKRTGEVSLVSAYDRPHGPDVEHDPYLVDPLSPTRTHIPLADFAGKYNILRSVFLDQPVRRFVQHFKDIDEFNDKLGNQLETDVKNAGRYAPDAVSESQFMQEAGGRISEGSGGSFQGPHRDLVSEPSQGAAELAATTPITPQEERSLVDYVNQFGRPGSPDDVARALEEMAVKKPSATVVSALRKISAGFQKHFPDYDTPAILKALSRAIYDKTIQTGRALPEAVEAEASDTGEDAGPGQQSKQPAAQNQPPGTQRRPQGPQDVKSPRALFRRKLNEKRDETLEHFAVVKNQVRNLFKRLPTGKHMAVTLDGAHTIGNNMGAQAEMSIRLESADKDKNALGYAKNFRGKKDILESAPAVLSSGAVKTLYHYDAKALAEKARLLREDEHFVSRAHSLKSMLGRSPSEEIKSAQKMLGTDLQNKLIEDGFLKHDNARYLFDTSAKPMLDKFIADVNLGTEQAKVMAARGNVWDKYRGRRWIKSNEKIMRTLEYAKAQWDHPELRSTAVRAKMEADRQFDTERDNGYSLHYDPEYLPGRYEGSVWSPNGIIFGGQKIMGRQYYAGKTFKNIYEAAKVGPYIPASLDIASLMGSRVRTGMNSVSQRMWWNSLKELKDENGNFVVKEGKPGGGAPSPDYVEFPLKGTMQKVYVHQSYVGLIHELTDPDVTMNNAASKLLLESTQFLKHTALLGDVFHLGRVMYYSQSIMGFKGAKFIPGWAATVIREGDLDRAVDRGIIAPKTRDYLKEKVAFRVGPKADMISRARLSELYERSGLNTGRIQDAIMKDLVKNMPGFGAYNRFLFDRFTTGLMKNAALKEFDRLSKLDPEKDSRQIVQESAKDLNLYFGSIGRQGWIKSATFRSWANIVALAPQWLEGLVKKETQPLKLLTNPHAALTGRTTAFRGMARGMAAMFALTQVANMITRGTPTWSNPEPDHKWEAWLPGNVWLSPLSVFNELTADILRIGETKQRKWDAVQQVGMNKLSFAGRFATVLATGNSPTGEYQSTTGGVLKKAAEQLIPIPISFGTWAQFGAHFLAPGTVPPVSLQQLMIKSFATMGIKTHAGLDPVQSINIAAQAFRQANGVEEPRIQFTDEATNSKLRYQLKDGDESGAARTLQQLRQHHTDGEIIQSMETWARRPFTSHVQEGMFQAGMDDYGRKVYNQAIQQRYDQVNQFLEWYGKQSNQVR